jgi:hypothetical protein
MPNPSRTASNSTPLIRNTFSALVCPLSTDTCRGLALSAAAITAQTDFIGPPSLGRRAHADLEAITEYAGDLIT